MRICSGEYQKGMKMHHSRIGKEIKVTDAVTFVAGDREHTKRPYRGTSSDYIIMEPFRSAIPSPLAKHLNSRVFPTSLRNCSSGFA